MKKLTVLFFFLCVLGRAQTPDKGKDIIQKSIAALGGDRFLHMQNRVASGRIYAFFRDQVSGLDVATVYTEYLPQRPAKGLAIREREVLGKKQDYSYLFLETQGWDITFRGARPIPDEDWQRYVRTTEHDILYMLRYRINEPGMLFDYVGGDVYLTTPVDIVDLTDAQNQTVRVYFDQNTHLPVHESFTWLDPDTHQRNEEVTEFDKYRDTGGGIMWPYSIERERNGYKTSQIFARQVQSNQALPAKIFELPPGAKLLRKVGEQNSDREGGEFIRFLPQLRTGLRCWEPLHVGPAPDKRHVELAGSYNGSRCAGIVVPAAISGWPEG
ncbi:MAG TPA: hypothetical protein VFB14_01945 [Bryobacteraceae bacterium]|nr:hypothetical protein [Bryobacteraceae bacterium]